MAITRIFQAISLFPNSVIELDNLASHHLATVLRGKTADDVIIFNGEGGDFPGKIITISKKKVTVQLGEKIPRDVESPLNLCLAQGISRGEKMDYTIQKAVELGVKKIIPLITERCNVKLDEDRRQKRYQHWQAVAISACEQSGRTMLPQVETPQTLTNWLNNTQADNCFVLDPQAKQKLRTLSLVPNANVIVLIGPEGGLSKSEINQAITKNFTPLNLGPRILRTETAAVAALSALQTLFGDI